MQLSWRLGRPVGILHKQFNNYCNYLLMTKLKYLVTWCAYAVESLIVLYEIVCSGNLHADEQAMGG